MQLLDKFHLTQDQNRRFARSNFASLVHTNSRFEGINTTLPQTEAIMRGLGVNGVSLDDSLTIVQIKRGWDYITQENAPMSLDIQKNINLIVAKNDSLAPGELRSGQGGVDIGEPDTWVPPIINPETEEKFLQDTMSSDMTTTEKALRVMYHDMRQQIFWDGNKRTATLSANKIMIDGGSGLINVPLNIWSEWNELLSSYYKSGKDKEILQWTYDHAIQGVEL